MNGIDYIGLWHWKYGKRNVAPRATIVADQDGDSYANLALQVTLDLSEIKQWLEPWKPNNEVKACEEFTIPNIVFIDRNHPINAEWFWTPYAVGEINSFTRKGYFVLYNVAVDNETVLHQFADPNIYGFENIADGDEDDKGSLQTTDLAGLRPGDIHLRYKLGGFKLIQCFGGELNWDSLVATGGYIWTWQGYLHIWDAPAHGFGF